MNIVIKVLFLIIVSLFISCNKTSIDPEKTESIASNDNLNIENKEVVVNPITEEKNEEIELEKYTVDGLYVRNEDGNYRSTNVDVRVIRTNERIILYEYRRPDDYEWSYINKTAFKISDEGSKAYEDGFRYQCFVYQSMTIKDYIFFSLE